MADGKAPLLNLPTAAMADLTAALPTLDRGRAGPACVPPCARRRPLGRTLSPPQGRWGRRTPTRPSCSTVRDVSQNASRAPAGRPIAAVEAGRASALPATLEEIEDAGKDLCRHQVHELRPDPWKDRWRTALARDRDPDPNGHAALHRPRVWPAAGLGSESATGRPAARVGSDLGIASRRPLGRSSTVIRPPGAPIWQLRAQPEGAGLCRIIANR
jgi:hypothetical protein